MRRMIMASLLPLLLQAAVAGASLPEAAGSVRVAQIRTATATTLDRLTYSGGSWLRTVPLNHTAVLLEHPRGRILLDTGLGEQVDQQFGSEMPWWTKPLLAYGKVTTAKAQLAAQGVPPPDHIVLTHGHWDHASGLVDFPQAQVWITAEEQAFLQQAKPPSVLPSQLSIPALRWQRYGFRDGPYAGFARSFDFFGDGSVVLVPLPGHTPGSVGVFAALPSGRRLFFVGDTVWRRAALDGPHEKFWFARRLVDSDREGTRVAIAQLRQLRSAYPSLILLPAHDAEAQDPLGYFPRWIE